MQEHETNLYPRPPAPLWEIFAAFLRLGLTSFGGPVAHLGYFRNEFVGRRRWLGEGAYADLVALCQFLPGPASSQVGFGLGLLRGGLAGAFLAWLGFTAPSAIALTLFGYGAEKYGNLLGTGFLHGLNVVAVAVVAQAVWSMARVLTPDRQRMTTAVVACIVVLAWPGSFGQIAAILGGASIGRLLFKPERESAPATDALFVTVGRTTAMSCATVFLVLLAGLPLAASIVPDHALALVDRLYRAGALVFGGGHVILPLLQSAVVPPGWVDNATFLAGYGAAQAVPGPLFTFAAYLGTVMSPAPNGWLGAILCLFAIYLPTFLLMIGAMPLWNYARSHPAIRAALTGVNAAVVGLLLAALYNPVWTSAILDRSDFMLALAAFLLLALWRTPPWLVVALTAVGGTLLAAF